MDARAVSHIMANPYSYEKPWILRQVLKRYMSEGLVVAEGHRHKVQRKIVQRLFSRNTMRQMNEVVVEKANQVSSLQTRVWDSEQGEEGQ
jgi:cytochrome P450